MNNTTTPKQWIVNMQTARSINQTIFKHELERDKLMDNARKFMPEHRLQAVRQARTHNRAILQLKRMGEMLLEEYYT